MRRILPLILFLCPAAFAQSSFLIPVQTTAGQGITGATVTLTCTDTTNGCVGKGPFSATSVNGNATFTAIPAGNYTVTTIGPNFTAPAYAYTVGSPPINGSTITPANINGVDYVGGNIQTWSGSDIGAQINSVNAALPAQGGDFAVLPNALGSCYSFATPITFTTVNKYLLGTSLAPPPTSPNTCGNNAQLLNYTPITATSAFTFDWTPSSGGGYEPGAGLREISLSNNLCQTNGGCGSSAIGANVGPVNSGAHSSLFFNDRFTGFGTAFALPDAGGNSWGITWLNSNCAWNTTCYSQSKSEESPLFIGTKMAVNGTDMNFANAVNGDVYDAFGSHDSSTSCSIQTNSATLGYQGFGKHFENLNVSGNVHYMCGGSAAGGLWGGTILDDNTTGSSATDAFVASNWMVFGPTIFSGGQTFTGHVFTVNGVGYINVLDTSPSVIPQSQIAFCGNGTMIEVIAPGNQPYICYGGAIQAGGNTPTLSAGTGACATTSTQVGGSWSGTFKCTGTTGASTITIAPGSTAANGWNCNASDETAGTAMPQSAHTTTTCTIKGTVNANDVIVFTANKF